jgi:formate dehydrogenase major subunit
MQSGKPFDDRRLAGASSGNTHLRKEETAMDLDRRSFLKAGGGAAIASSMAVLGFGDERQALAQAVRPYKLARTTETRNTCPYCSVSCGVLMYSLGDKSKNAKAEIIHIEGDPDHPVNRGTLCPKGAGLLDFVRAKTRTKYPMHRKPGTDKFERVSWDFALDRIARLMKDDRDKNFVSTRDGSLVNRWTTTGMLAASATTNETAYITWKAVRSLGMVVFDNQARV